MDKKDRFKLMLAEIGTVIFNEWKNTELIKFYNDIDFEQYMADKEYGVKFYNTLIELSSHKNSIEVLEEKLPIYEHYFNKHSTNFSTN